MILQLEIQDNKFDDFMKIISDIDFVNIKNDDNFYLSDEQKAELDRRYSEIQNGTAKTVSMDEIMKILQDA